MDTLNNTPAEAVPAPVEAVASAPEVAAAPVETAAPVAAAAPAPAPTPAAPAAPRVKMELPKTDGNTVGGWNRFAGYNPNAAKNKQKDGRGGSGGRGR
jgi:hypothetical protein